MLAAVMTAWIKDSLLLIPAYNEEAALGPLLDEVRGLYPDLAVAVVDDGSDDQTSAVARARGAVVLGMPCNLGVGGAMQAGFEYAVRHGYRQVIRCDGDGQHPPAEIPKLIAALQSSGADLVVGSRFLSSHAYDGNFWRLAGIRGLAAPLLSAACRQRITDPTSGFQALNRLAAFFLARNCPADYPEPEAIALLTRQGYRVHETAVMFRPRQGGRSSIGNRIALYYALKVILALVLDRARAVDPRFQREQIRGRWAS